jgi:Ca-activated chloride channel homolog
MFRFANTEFFWLYWLIVLSVFLYAIASYLKKNSLRKFGNPDLLKHLYPQISVFKGFLRIVLITSALAMIILASTRPQLGTKLQEMKREGVEIIIALDVSNSMLAEDFQPNRLERAKQAIFRMTDRLINDKIGLIVFAGDAFVQVPLTTDYTITKMMTANVATDIVPVQGTAIGRAISLAETSFSTDAESSKVIILISDGENHEDDPVEQARKTADKGIIIHVVGVGDTRGTPISLPDRSGQKRFLTDPDGNVVMTRLDESTLSQIASIGGGVYVRASGSDFGLSSLLEKVSELEKSEFEAQMFTDFEERFQYFAALALLFLVIEFFVSEKKSSFLNRIFLFSTHEKK